jgi:rhodanese-related sulfurtransferase
MNELLLFATKHPVQVSLLVASLLAVLVYELRMRASGEGSISPQQVVQLMNRGAPVLDLRKPESYASGHINTARNVAPADIATAADSLKRFKEKPVVVYCDSGISASGTIKQLASLGFTRVYKLRGGLDAWRRENLPVTRKTA